MALPQAVLVVVDAATALAPLKNTGCAHLRKGGVGGGSEGDGWRDGIAVSYAEIAYVSRAVKEEREFHIGGVPHNLEPACGDDA